MIRRQRGYTHLKNISHKEVNKSISREKQCNNNNSQNSQFKNAELLDKDPAAWFRQQNPNWTDEQIAHAVRLVKGAEMVDLYEALEERAQRKQRRV